MNDKWLSPKLHTPQGWMILWCQNTVFWLALKHFHDIFWKLDMLFVVFTVTERGTWQSVL